MLWFCRNAILVSIKCGLGSGDCIIGSGSGDPMILMVICIRFFKIVRSKSEPPVSNDVLRKIKPKVVESIKCKEKARKFNLKYYETSSNIRMDIRLDKAKLKSNTRKCANNPCCFGAELRVCVLFFGRVEAALQRCSTKRCSENIL